MITGIEHTAIYAKDTKKLADWYAELLDGKIVYSNSNDVHFVAFADGSMIEFCPCKNTFDAPEFEDSGMRHIAFSVDDFYEASSKIRASKAPIERDTAISSSGVKTMFFRDPEGNIIHIISRTNPLV